MLKDMDWQFWDGPFQHLLISLKSLLNFCKTCLQDATEIKSLLLILSSINLPNCSANLGWWR